MRDDFLRQLLWTVPEWNRWRKQHPEIRAEIDSGSYVGMSFQEADLSDAFLYNSDFSRVNFSNATLRDATFRECRVVGASFRHSWSLQDATFARNTDLTSSNFEMARMDGTRFSYTNLTEVSFQRATLREVEFAASEMGNCDFTNAVIAETRFFRVNIGSALGLEEVTHLAPSYVDATTVRLSLGRIPASFLRGCGFSDMDICLAKLADPNLSHGDAIDILYEVDRLRMESPIQKHPIFISYSHKDSAFVSTLEKLMNESRIRYWRDVHDLTSGRLETQLDRVLSLQPTVLLILSANSVDSDWVEWEAHRARRLEKEIKRDVLCPIALDDSWKTCSWPETLRLQIADYNVLDFSLWEESSFLRTQFRKLREGLHLFYLRDYT